MLTSCKLCGNTINYRKRDNPNSVNYRNKTGFCVKCFRTKGVLRGSIHPNWKGGRTTHRGYVYINLNAINDKEVRDMCVQTVENRKRGKRRSGMVYEHHVKMIEKIRRPLRAGEVVHHKNGDKSDNRIENLVLATTKDNLRSHKELYFENIELRRRLASIEKLLRASPNSIEI